MNLRLKLFASFREAVGARELDVAMPEGARVSDLLQQLRQDYPRLDATLDQGMIAVNHEYVGHETVLSDGDEVGLIPPVSGGC